MVGLDPAEELLVKKMGKNLLKLIGVGEFDKVRCSVHCSVFSKLYTVSPRCWSG